MLLSDRMRAVAELVQPCKSIADIGCDHGYVAMELVRSNICRHVIAMDINRGPLDRARQNIADYDMQEYIETRLSDGVSALQKGEVGRHRLCRYGRQAGYIHTRAGKRAGRRHETGYLAATVGTGGGKEISAQKWVSDRP